MERANTVTVLYYNTYIYMRIDSEIFITLRRIHWSHPMKDQQRHSLCIRDENIIGRIVGLMNAFIITEI